MTPTQWQTTPALQEDSGSLPFSDPKTGQDRDYYGLAFTVPEAGDGHTARAAFVVPQGFREWLPKAVSLLQAVKSWSKDATNLDVFLRVTTLDGTVLATKTVTYSSSEDASEYTEFAISANDLVGKFRRGDVVVVEAGSPDSGNTGETTNGDWEHWLSRIQINWR